VNQAAMDVVRAYFDAWNRRDVVALEAALDRDVE
jgi:ketosteroid isomerase-like protein